MTEKAISTRTRQAQQRRERILGASMELFWEKCVEDASMEEVAKRAGAGPATVYRYFSTKVELVIETAELYWERVARKYLQELEEANTGYAQIEKTLDIFYKIFQDRKTFFEVFAGVRCFCKKISDIRRKADGL